MFDISHSVHVKHPQKSVEQERIEYEIYAATKKKYKPVALKVKSHIGPLPDKF